MIRTCENCKFYGEHYCNLRNEEVCTDNPFDSCGLHAMCREEMDVSISEFNSKVVKIRELNNQEWDEFPF
ncbi:MAG: hypothetical protein ACRCX2_00760 [Paraclostridium sp.]